MTRIVNVHSRMTMSNKEAARRKAAIQAQRESAFVPTFKPLSSKEPFRRVGLIAGSAGDKAGSATKENSLTYTGSKIIGLGQMHKSNLVPIFQAEDAEAIAHMRR